MSLSSATAFKTFSSRFSMRTPVCARSISTRGFPVLRGIGTYVPRYQTSFNCNDSTKSGRPAGPRLQEPQPRIHCAEHGVGCRRILPEPAIEHRGVEAAEVDRVLHVSVAIEVREVRVVAVGPAAHGASDAERQAGGAVVGPSLVFRHPPSELAPGEDQYPLLRIAIRGLDAREIVVEGADRSSQRAHEVRVVDSLVAVR